MPPWQHVYIKMVSLRVLCQWRSKSYEDKNNNIVFVNADGTGYDHLHVSDTSVKWYRGLQPDASMLEAVYCVETNVLQVFWCSFLDHESNKKTSTDKVEVLKCLCIREESLLSLFFENGSSYSVPLPFKIHSMWPIKYGILIERDTSMSKDENLPVFFTIGHPFDDVCPVTCRRTTSFLKDSSNCSLLGYITSPELHIVAVCDSIDPLVVTYDTRDNTHTVWTIKKATNEDIPSPVSTPGPGGTMLMSLATPTPHSSSAPVYCTHHSGASPIKFSLQVPVSVENSNKRRSIYTPLRNPMLKRLQQSGSPYCFTDSSKAKTHHKGNGDFSENIGSSKAISGRSPFVNRYITPQDNQQIKMKHAKSLSPQLHYARISPYSQTMNSHSWSTFYNEDSITEPFEFLLPQVCIHQVWSELPCEKESMIFHSCSDAFLTTDFSGNDIVCLQVPSLCQLRLIYVNKNSVKVNDIFIIDNVLQAISFQSLNMMLIFRVDGSLCLYSGTRRVCDVSYSILDDCVKAIRDPNGSEFTLVTNSGCYYRCSIPHSYDNSIVSLCLHCLCSILPSEYVSGLRIAYYNTSWHWFKTDDVWNSFEAWLLTCMGVRHLESHATSYRTDSDWFNLLQIYSNDSLLNQDPVLRLLMKDYKGMSNKQCMSEFTNLVSLQNYIACITSGLHLVYEEAKLDIHLHHYIPQLSKMLFRLTQHLGWSSFMDHYYRDNPSLSQYYHEESTSESSTDTGMVEDNPLYSVTSPPGIYQTLYALLQKQIIRYPVLGGVCKRSEMIMKIFSFVFKCWGVSNDCIWELIDGVNNSNSYNMDFDTGNESSLDDLINYLNQQQITLNELKSFPVGITLPLWSLLFHCQVHPSSSWTQRIYQLIGREDISETLFGQKQMVTKLEYSPANDDGMNFDEEILKLLFSSDLRVKEVRRLLCSSKPIRIVLEQKPEVSDHEFVEQQELHLLTLCQRTMALPVGRGMFGLATIHPMPTEPLNIPFLNIDGQVFPNKASVSLDNVDKPVNMTDWPEFHNGVAAGLKIAPDISILDSTWIVFNHPLEDESVCTYAGFLMALGLNGHLTNLTAFNTFEYLQEKHELTVIGLLLGISAARCGSMDLHTASLLSIFFPPLLPLGSADLEISTLMQTSAMLSLGLLYMGSHNRFMVQTMLKEIGHSPGPELDFADNRESYSLTAGLALGMVALSAGNNAVSLNGLDLVNQLCLYINGGLKTDSMAIDTSGTSHLIMEGPYVNTHVTAPGAVLALGMIYLKSNDLKMASHLAPPATHHQLDCIRPDVLMIKVLCSSLILWDSILPTQDWINSYIPQIVQQYAFSSNQITDDIDIQTMSQSLLYITAGCSLALGFRFAGSCRKDVYDTLMISYEMIRSHIQSNVSSQVGEYCIETCFHTTLLSLAMVMSGSGDLNILRLIRYHHSRIAQHDASYGRHMATHMALGLLFLGGGRYCLSTGNKAIAGLLCAVFPHFPINSTDNRYHLQALRHLYVLGAEPRVLVTREWDTDQLCSVPVQIHHQVNGVHEVIEKQTPCLLPVWDQITMIEVLGPRYWYAKYNVLNDFVKQRLMKNGTIFVKKHVGYFGYETDPKGQKSILSLAVLSPNQYLTGGINGKIDIPSASLSCDPYINQIYHHLCNNQIYCAALLDCMTQDKMKLLNVYLQLGECVNSPLFNGTNGLISLWQIKLCWSFCQLLPWLPKEYNLGSFTDYVEGAMVRLKTNTDKQFAGNANLLYLYINGPNSLSVNESETLVYTLVVQDIPYLDSTETSNDMTSLIWKQNISQLSAVNLTVTLTFPLLAS